MSGTRTISAGARVPRGALQLVLALLALALLLGCERGARAPKAKPRAAAAQASAAASQSEPVLPPLIAETLRSVHEEKLLLRPPPVAPQLLDFGAGRLAQASGERVIFRDTEGGDAISEQPIGAVRAVAHGSDGALFAIGAKRGVRLLPRARSVQSFPAPIFLPDATLFGDLADPSHLLIFVPSNQQLYQFSFRSDAGPFLPLDEQFALTGCTGAIGLMRDGAFVCGTESGLARKAPRGARTAIAWASAPQSFWLLSAKRLDELFAIDLAGGVQHLRWSGALQVLEHFQLPAPPYAAASNGEALAFVLVRPPEANQPRRWSLLVTDFEGQTRFQSELPASPARVGDDWAAAAVEDKNLAISNYEPLVAIGGANRVTVFSYAAGRQVFAR